MVKATKKAKLSKNLAKSGQQGKCPTSSQTATKCSTTHEKLPCITKPTPEPADLRGKVDTPESVDISGKNQFLLAAQKNDPAEFASQLEAISQRPDAVNFADYSDRTALILASIGGNCNVVKCLLDNKHVLLDSQDLTGFTALMHAAQRGYDHIVKLLLKRKANHELRNILGDTAIILASRRNQIGCLQVLADFVKNPTDWTVTGEFGLTAELWAGENGHPEAVDFIRRIVASQLTYNDHLSKPGEDARQHA